VSDPTWPQIQTLEDYKNLPQHIRQEVEEVFKFSVPSTNTANTDSMITVLKQSIENVLPSEHKDFLNHHAKSYSSTNCAISDMVEKKIMISPPPIKKQTLAEKKYIVKNFEQCLEVYNQWIEMNPTVGNPVEMDLMDSFAATERNNWKPDLIVNSVEPAYFLPDQPPTEQ
jgi:hypothetical protein